MKDHIKIHENDNVIVALQEIKEGTVVEGVKALCDIPAGHKMAIKDIPEGG